MSRGQFDRRRQLSPFVSAVVAIVVALVAVCIVVTVFGPAGAR